MVSDEIQELIDNSSRPPAGRTMPYVKVAEHLEEFGTSRADFRELSDSQRIAVGKRIVIHCNRYAIDGQIVGREEAIFFHLCGSVGIDFGEARAMWNNATEGHVTMDDIYEMWEDDE